MLGGEGDEPGWEVSPATTQFVGCSAVSVKTVLRQLNSQQLIVRGPGSPALLRVPRCLRLL